MNADNREDTGDARDRADEALRDTFAPSGAEQVKDSLRQYLHGFREDLREHPYVQRLTRRPARPRLRPALGRFTLAGAGLACAVVALIVLGGSSTPTWAQVVERFGSVDFFSATIYTKQDALAEPEQIELWMGRGGRVRLRVKTQVVFAERGQVTRAFDVNTGRETEPLPMATQTLRMLGDTTAFSLDTVVRAMSGGRLSNTTPLVNAAAAISNDLVIFDVESDRTPEWLRIWALRESRLPVRVRVWDPRDGDCVDCVFDYSKEQPEAFFDAAAFAAELQKQTGEKTTSAYALLKDPGGRMITPGDVSRNASSYHMPVIEQVGITPEGAVWVTATKSQNRRPDGRPFYGFETVEDDLGRAYPTCAWSSCRVAGDRSLQAFLPEDYPFDKRVPTRLTFICRVEQDDRRQTGELIGKATVTEWKKGSDPGGSVTDPEARIRQAYRFLHAADWPRLERLLATVPGEPEDNPQAFGRDRIRLGMFVKKGEFQDAVKLGDRLMPLLENEYRRWKGDTTYAGIFQDYIVALAAAGRLEDARAAFQRVAAIEPVLPDDLSARGRKQITERNKESFNTSLWMLAEALSRTAHLTVQQIGQVLGTDVKTDKRLSRFKGSAGTPNGQRTAVIEEMGIPPKGYHMPVIEQVGITPDGAVWVTATRSENRRPDRRTFYGFETVADDLNRRYAPCTWAEWRLPGDRSLQVFIPEDYPFDERVPTRLTFTCRVRGDVPGKVGALIGKAVVTESKRGSDPEGKVTDAEAHVRLAWHFPYRENWRKLEPLLATVPGEPEDTHQAFERDRIRLSMFVRKARFEDAAKLGERLMPLLEEEYRRWKGTHSTPSIFDDYIVALAAAGRLEDARAAFRRAAAITPVVPDHLSAQVRERITADNAEGVVRNIWFLGEKLLRTAHLTFEQIAEILGVDVRTDKRYSRYRGWARDAR